MKRSLLTTLCIALLALVGIGTMTTSCDSIIATNLEGTWEGDMYVMSEYNGREYYSSFTEIEFISDPMRFKSGEGYWLDHYSGAPWDYIANHLTWTVHDKVIYIHLIEDNYDIEIRKYHLDDERFYGYVYYDGGYHRFELFHTSSPHWDEYEYGCPYYSNSRAAASTDSMTVVRKMRK